MRVPVSTYRLQIRESFDLRQAATIVPYLADLGVDWAYLSPLLAAEPGSDHGYDVVDHARVDASRGGREGLESFSASARAEGLGVLVDIVPNHMGVATPEQNGWWWDVLAHGRDAEHAAYFDIDWDFGGGRLRLPILGEQTVAEAIASGGLARDGDLLRYYDTALPIAPGTGEGELAEVVDRQHYELMHWQRADAELNYRRFFAVSTLAAIRVERPEVFADSHAEIERWVREGLVDGLRVDHPDGLADPGGYLDDLARATGGAYVLVEKILEGDEQLPPFWATAGTTGYDALADVDRVLVDPAGRRALDALDARLRGDTSPPDWAELIHRTKRGIADGILRSEVLRLARVTPDPVDATPDALAELLACFPVYRSYLPLGLEHLEQAADAARRHRPDIADEISRLQWLLSDASTELATRFQQTSGMVMAKGVEDTAFYRYSRLPSLTEVGADPAEFSIDLDEFHRRQETRQARLPLSQTTLSTHDTKRGEDTRARIAVLAEVPERWEARLAELRELAPIGDGPFESLLWGSAIGAWPLSRERLHAYAEKASREAGDSTSWNDVDEPFEQRMHAAVDAAFDDERVHGLLEEFAGNLAPFGWSNSLAAKLIQLTAPGVPDVYQGSELWETSLVDPDNRRPVDFDERRLYLAAIDAGAHPPIDVSGAAKLLVTSRALRLRRDRPELFTRYTPLPAVGEAARHVVAFDRGGAITIATRLPVGLLTRGGWGDTTMLLPGVPLYDVLSDTRHEGGEVPLAQLLHRYPVALLRPADETEVAG